MKKALFYAILSLLLIPSGRSSAQSVLGMSPVIQNFTDTVPWNFTDSFNVWVDNYGPNTFNGDIRVYFACDSGAGPKIFKVDSTTLFGVSNFQMNDSLQVQAFYTYIPSSVFKPGGNTIVIWPQRASGSTATTLDTLKQKVYIDPQSGIREKSGLPPFRIFPNPVTTTARIYPGLPLSEVQEYRLYGTCGNLVAVLPPGPSIDMRDQAAGMYYLEMRLRNGQKQVTKVIRQ